MHTSYSPWRSVAQQQQRHTLKQLQHWHNRCQPSRTGLLLKCNSSKHQDLYVVLGVHYDADAPAIRAAFRAKAKLLHPDVNKGADAEAAFRLLSRAHEVLSDTMLRAAHDNELREHLPEASAALRASDPRFARFERWRREIMPDLNAQLDVWTHEVMDLVDASEAALSRQEQEFRWAMVQASPPASANSSLDWHSSSSGSIDSRDSSRQDNMHRILYTMQETLGEAVGNVQRLYDKRYGQIQVKFPAYPDIVWYDRWLEESDAWLDASEQLVKRWRPRIAAVAQWLPAAVPVGTQ